jgi:uncharacterized DUF497 family protein
VETVRIWAKNRHLLGLDNVVFPIYNVSMDFILNNFEGFEWDEGNDQKSFLKHGIKPLEAEETFFNPNFISADPAHSQSEKRYRLLGRTNSSKVLIVAFTIRSNKARVISSRLANKKERTLYAQALKANS